MTISKQIAHHLITLYNGGNWTAVSLKDALAGLTWQEANTKLPSFNSITALVYHCHYYVHAILHVLQGGPLLAADKFSFDHPVIASQTDWDAFINTVFSEAETLSELIAQLPDNILVDTFTDEKYGNYYRNLQGMIEHTHYHLGQIVVLKKMILAS